MEPTTTGPEIPWMATLDTIRLAAEDWSGGPLIASDRGCVHDCFGKTYIRTERPRELGAVYRRDYKLIRVSQRSNYRVICKVRFADVFARVSELFPEHARFLKSRFWYEVHVD